MTLVLCDRDGRLLGSLDPFEVETPWWQDVLPIVEQVPGVTVLRLLACGPNDDNLMGGPVTYLVEVAGETPSGLKAWPGELEDHPLRMPWASPGGPARDLDWVAGEAEIEGTPTQHRAWNLSAIWSIPLARSTAWLKCVPPFFAHEAAVLRLLAGETVPCLLGAEGHRVLLAEMPGRDGYEASSEEQVASVEALVTLQLNTADRVSEFLAAGVPDRRGARLSALCADVVERRAPSDERLRSLVDTAGERMAAVEECGLPDVLVHGDAHAGNTRLGASHPIWFDWGDSIVGNPLLDLVALSEDSDGEKSRGAGVESHWLGLWADAVPHSDPQRAWQLLRPLAELRLAVLYQSFLDQIEPSERPFHERDVLPALERAAKLV